MPFSLKGKKRNNALVRLICIVFFGLCLCFYFFFHLFGFDFSREDFFSVYPCLSQNSICRPGLSGSKRYVCPASPVLGLEVFASAARLISIVSVLSMWFCQRDHVLKACDLVPTIQESMCQWQHYRTCCYSYFALCGWFLNCASVFFCQVVKIEVSDR